MAGPTHELIEAKVLSSDDGGAGIEFTSIPQTFTDLEIVFSLKYSAYSPTNMTNQRLDIRANGSTTTTHYPYIYQGANQTSSGSRDSLFTENAFQLTAGMARADTRSASCGRIEIIDYTTTTVSSVQAWNSTLDYNATTGYNICHTKGHMNVGAAITSLKFTTYNSNTIASGSYIRLYGINRNI